MNKGYGYLWYSECLTIENKIETALWFYKQTFNIWKKYSENG